MDIHEKDQYVLTIKENGKIISGRTIPDPLHCTTLTYPRGFRAAWNVFWRGLQYSIMISASREAERVIFSGNYAPIMGAEETKTAVGEEKCWSK